MRNAVAILLAFAAGLACAQPFAPVTPGTALRFPGDAGAHPAHRIEWWYVTGHLDSARGPLGFQVTFFRWRHREAEANPSRFSPKQLLFAHAALADPAKGHLLHDQRSARMLEPLVQARVGETDLRLDGWTLRRSEGAYRTHIEGQDFALDLQLTPTQPVMLQGDRGYSRKGPGVEPASYYYSEPQLHAGGRVRVGGEWLEVTGVAWLDHEWSSEILAANASGWDWLGVNFDDGGALMAFRIRDRAGATLWSAATMRARGAEAVSLAPGAVAFTPLGTWTSPRTGIAYPVRMEVRVGEATWRIVPLLDDQELDARASTGTLYWEGAVRVEGARGARGRGYLELTGYADRLPF